jgi:hypothetical protein
MRSAVYTAFPSYTDRFEGVAPGSRGGVPFFYLDVKSLVTIARGNLVDPISLAMSLPLVSKVTGMPATPEQIRAAWFAVKQRTDLAKLGGLHFRDVTDLILTDDGIDEVTRRKLLSVDRDLALRFSLWDYWCCDAQLAMCSIAWADGDAFRFPRMIAAMMAGDWGTAASESGLDEHGNAGLHPRNIADRILLTNAGEVARRGMDPDVLYYPRDLASETAETDPAPVDVAAVRTTTRS